MSYNLKSILILIASIFLCQAVGISSALLSNIEDRSWFNALIKPSWNPPSYLFAPVWTILYALMGISFWFILKQITAKNQKTNAIILFCVQLVLNFLWSILFFRYQLLGYALLDIILLDVMVIATILTFYPINKIAAWLLLPYLMWILFASYLNYTIWVLN